jgi:2-polyprenyl-3-methyl-5-hydroxy-6-metoxy-1,4-benzoquinol methylase
MSNGPDADGLKRLRQVSSFMPARIILTANHYRIFDHCETRGKTAASLSRTLRTDSRATELLLNSLVSLGLLKKNGNRYSNAGLSSRYLVKGKPEYQGDIMDHYNVLWHNWSGLDTVLKTGKPFRKAHDHESFILGMNNIAALKGKDVIKALDLRGVERLLDLGGGPGTYSMAFARRKIDVTLLDFPDTLRISERLIREAGLEKKIRLLPGDFTINEWGGGYDMIFISQIFHAYTAGGCLQLLRKSRAALNPDGRVVVQEFYLDETRANPPVGAIFAINMLVNTPGGRTYTPKEMSTWMKKAGFVQIDKKLLGDTVLLIGTGKKD